MPSVIPTEFSIIASPANLYFPLYSFINAISIFFLFRNFTHRNNQPIPEKIKSKIKNSIFLNYSINKSGRFSAVIFSAMSILHFSMFSVCPDNNISGTFNPLNSGGRV